MPQQIKKQMALTCLISTRDGFTVVFHPYSMDHIHSSFSMYVPSILYLYVWYKIRHRFENHKKFGEWHKIIVDEQLPLKIFEKKKAHGGFRRGNTFQPEKVEDYWALLLEKVKIYDSDLTC